MPTYISLRAPVSLPSGQGIIFDASYSRNANFYRGPQTAQPIQNAGPAPVIAIVSVGSNQVTIAVGNGGLTNLYNSRVYLNGRQYGFFKQIDGQIVITGLTNGVKYKIKLKNYTWNLVYQNNGGSSEQYFTAFSNEIEATPLLSLGNRSMPDLVSTDVRVERVSMIDYFNCKLKATSTVPDEDYNGNPIQAEPIPFKGKVLISSFSAEVKFKARVHFGALDSTWGGGVLGNMIDVKITLNKVPFSDSNFGNIGATDDLTSQYFDAIIARGDGNPNTDIAGNPFALYLNPGFGNTLFDVEMYDILRQEFVLSTPYIENRIEMDIRSNYMKIFSSEDAIRDYLNILNINVPMTTSLTSYPIRYEGLIFIEAKFISPNGFKSPFSFNILNEKGNVIKSVSNVLSCAVLPPISACITFSSKGLKELASSLDVFGAREYANEADYQEYPVG